MYVVLLVVYQKNYKRDVTDIWNQENINVHDENSQIYQHEGERPPCYFNKRYTEMYVLNQGIKSSTRVFSMYPLLTLFRRELLLFDIVVYSSFNIRVNLAQYFSQSGLIFQPIWFNI